MVTPNEAGELLKVRSGAPPAPFKALPGRGGCARAAPISQAARSGRLAGRPACGGGARAGGGNRLALNRRRPAAVPCAATPAQRPAHPVPRPRPEPGRQPRGAAGACARPHAGDGQLVRAGGGGGRGGRGSRRCGRRGGWRTALRCVRLVLPNPLQQRQHAAAPCHPSSHAAPWPPSSTARWRWACRSPRLRRRAAPRAPLASRTTTTCGTRGRTWGEPQGAMGQGAAGEGGWGCAGRSVVGAPACCPSHGRHLCRLRHCEDSVSSPSHLITHPPLPAATSSPTSPRRVCWRPPAATAPPCLAERPRQTCLPSASLLHRSFLFSQYISSHHTTERSSLASHALT